MSKKLLHSTCLSIVEEKIMSITQLIADAQASSNNDTKSSMGDKYETTREMMQIEINKLQKQLHETQQILLALKVLDPEKTHSTAESGALVETDKMHFYIAAPLGKVSLQNSVYMVISPASPLGKAMSGKRTGESAAFNGVNYRILSVV